MSYILKNPSGSDFIIEDLDATVPSLGTYDLTLLDAVDIRASEDLLLAVASGALVLNDGLLDVAPTRAVQVLFGALRQFLGYALVDTIISTSTLWSSEKIWEMLQEYAPTAHTHVHSAVTDDQPERHRQIDDSQATTTSLWSSTKISTLLATKAPLSHTHIESDITDLRAYVLNTYTLSTPTGSGLRGGGDFTSWRSLSVFPAEISHADLADIGVASHAVIDTHLGDTVHHRVINDVGVSRTDLFSAAEIITRLATKSDVSHTHVHSAITDDQPERHRQINDSGVSNAELWSSFKINGLLATKSHIGHTHVESDITNLKEYALAARTVGTGSGLTGGGTLQQDITLSVVPGDIQHDLISGHGTHAHTDIDTHIDSTSIHRSINDAGVTTTDLFSASHILDLLSLKSDTSHTHVHSTITDDQPERHREIDDSGVSLTDLWSAAKISTLLATKAPLSHTHIESDITDLQTYALRARQIITNVGSGLRGGGDLSSDRTLSLFPGEIPHSGLSGAGTNSHTQIDTHISTATIHRQINDGTTTTTNLWSASKTSAMLATKQNLLGYVPENVANRGVANGYAPLGSDGKLPDTFLPALAITSVFVRASQSEQLALIVQEGDVCIRTDTGESWIAIGATNTSMSNWVPLAFPVPVTSVNGYIGAVVLTKSDVGLSNVVNQLQLVASNNLSDVLDVAVSRTNLSVPSIADLTAHTGDDTLHRQINDSGVDPTDLWSAAKISTLLATKSDTSHTHVHSAITDDQPERHREIDDAGVGLTDLWSAAKISTLLATKSQIGHTHIESDITNLQTYALRARQIITNVGSGLSGGGDLSVNRTLFVVPSEIPHSGLSGTGTNSHTQIDTHISTATIHRQINDAGVSTTELWSAAKTSTALATKQNLLGYVPENVANRGVANGYAPIGSDGKLPDTFLPALAIINTYQRASQSAQLSLVVQTGDICVRTDTNETFIALSDVNTSMSNWVRFLFPVPVTSVNGYIGAVVLTKSDVGLSNVVNQLQLVASNNLSDVTSVGTARTNLSVPSIADLTAHVATSGAHGNTVSQWDARWIQDVEVDGSAIGDGKSLVYDATTGKIVYRTVQTGSETQGLECWQGRRVTTYLNIPASWWSIPIETVDYQVGTSISIDPVDTTRVVILQSGMYLIAYGMTTAERKVDGRVLVNYANIAVGSTTDTYSPGSSKNSILTQQFLYDANAGDVLQLQIRSTAAGGDFTGSCVWTVIRLSGVKGDKGDPGVPGASGGTIRVNDDGVFVADSVHTVNFVGTSSVSSGGAGIVNVSAGGGTGNLNFEFGNDYDATAGCPTSETTLGVRRYLDWPGSSVFGVITSVRFLVRVSSSSATGTFQLYNETTGAVVTQCTTNSTTPTVVEVTGITPENPSVLSIRSRVNSSSYTAYLYNVMIRI